MGFEFRSFSAPPDFPLFRFKSGQLHHLAGTPYRFYKAHDGFLTLSPHHRELVGIPFVPAPVGGPGRLCACALLFFVLRGGDCGPNTEARTFCARISC